MAVAFSGEVHPRHGKLCADIEMFLKTMSYVVAVLRKARGFTQCVSTVVGKPTRRHYPIGTVAEIPTRGVRVSRESQCRTHDHYSNASRIAFPSCQKTGERRYIETPGGLRYPAAMLELEAEGGFFARFVGVEDALIDGETPDEAPFDASKSPFDEGNAPSAAGRFGPIANFNFRLERSVSPFQNMTCVTLNSRNWR
ncbi:MAG: hypothetical protein V9G98_21665 [Candidatus Competibacter sp.]